MEIPTLKPVKIRTPEFLSELKAFEPDLLVVAAYDDSAELDSLRSENRADERARVAVAA